MARPAPGRAGAASPDARILAVAADHLRRLGPNGVRVVAVAAEAGMTHANVYRYFPTRTALLEAVSERWLRGLEAAMGTIADSPDPADDKLERLLTALAAAQRDALRDDPHLMAVHLAAVGASSPTVRRHRSRLRSLVERVIDEGAASGTFAPRDRERAVAFVFDACHRFIHPAAVRLDAEVPRDLAAARLATVVRAVVRGLRVGLV